MSESSVARPLDRDVIGGADADARIVVDGLMDAGFFCVDARRNETAAHLWCRRKASAAAAVVDIVATPEGDVQHARIAVDGTPDARTSAEWLRRVLSASFLRAWPKDKESVIGAIRDAEQTVEDRSTATTDESRATDFEWRETDLNEDRTLSIAALTMTATVTADRGSTRRWPYGADHYATRLGPARESLDAVGFNCDPDVGGYTRCTRPNANQEVQLTSRNDQITSAAFGVGSIVAADGSTTPLGDPFPNGLPFLTARVEPAVQAQIERFRRTGDSFIGVVAGTVLVIDERAPAAPTRKRFATYADVVIGVPLIEGFPGG